MNTFTASFIAGLVATIVLSILMLLKSAMGITPELNVAAMLGWLTMMIILMPIMAHGFFATGMESAPKPAIATLTLHIIFGFALGYTYCKLMHKKPS